MSASPGDAQPVFDLIARQAAKLCNVPTAAVATFDGTMMHLATQSGFDAAYADAYVSQFPRPVGLDFSMGRAILNRRVDQVEDITADPGHSFADVLGHWSVMAVPILRDDVPLGAITIGRPAMGPFSDSQVTLLQTFAEQAVIAITSAETYRELQERTEALAQRNSEFGERIEQQSATIDVLKAMSASPDDAQPVFDLITGRAQQLCNSRGASIYEYDGELVHVRSTAAFGGVDPVASSGFAAAFPMAPTRGTIAGRAILDKRVIHVRDMDADPDLLPIVRDLVVRDAGVKSVLAIPLLRDGVAIGAFLMNANAAGGFSDSQLALLQTFAEQAVIAISSAETYRALRTRTSDLQGLHLNTSLATSDVLKVISQSAFDLRTRAADSSHQCRQSMPRGTSGPVPLSRRQVSLRDRP